MSGPIQQNPDGSWSEAVPIGWQGSGIDWEVYRNEKPLRAMGYGEDVLLENITARTRLGLAWKMRRAQRKHGMSGSVFG